MQSLRMKRPACRASVHIALGPEAGAVDIVQSDGYHPLNKWLSQRLLDQLTDFVGRENRVNIRPLIGDRVLAHFIHERIICLASACQAIAS